MDKRKLVNPCYECIVKAICSKVCILYHDYIDDIIIKKCKFEVIPVYNTSTAIWRQIRGSITLAGYFEESNKNITISYTDRNITCVCLKRLDRMHIKVLYGKKKKWLVDAHNKIYSKEYKNEDYFI